MCMPGFSHVRNAMETFEFCFVPIDNGDPRWPPPKFDEIEKFI